MFFFFCIVPFSGSTCSGVLELALFKPRRVCSIGLNSILLQRQERKFAQLGRHFYSAFDIPKVSYFDISP